MKRTSLLAAVLTGVLAWAAQGLTAAEPSQAAALDIKSITAKPTADNPQYKDKSEWPNLAGDEDFVKEKWSKGRLLIWAHPGEKERRQGPKFTPTDPACWIDAATGQPAASVPDMETDVILPDADAPYEVSVPQPGPFKCRHLTICRNAKFRSWCYVDNIIFGNVWVRPGGTLSPSQLRLAGNHHTFLRQDWPADGRLKKMHDERVVTPFDPKVSADANPWLGHFITVYLTHDKEPGKSTETVGFVSAADEVAIKSGTFIVGRDSRFFTSGPASIAVLKGAKVVLLDGAHCLHGQNQFVSDAGGNRDWQVDEGAEVSGGTPDRPLRRDAYMGLGYSNWMNLPVAKLPDEKMETPVLPSGAKRYYGYGGYNAMISGKLVGYPAPGSDARLVVCWQRIASGGPGTWGRQDEIIKSVFPKILPKITVWFSGAAMLENVRFDDLHRGGIVAPSMDAFRKWKNITFGNACFSKDPNELVRGYEAEIATMKDAGPMSILEPKEKYTTK